MRIRIRYILTLIVLLILLIPGIILFPVEVGLIVFKNIVEGIILFAEDEDPDEAIKKIYAFVFSVAAVKLTGDLFYFYFGVDLNSLVEEGRLTVKDLELGNTDLRKRVIDLRREYFRERGGLPEVLFENFVRLMSWDDDQLIRQMIIDHQRRELEELFQKEEEEKKEKKEEEDQNGE